MLKLGSSECFMYTETQQKCETINKMTRAGSGVGLQVTITKIKIKFKEY